MKRIAFIATGCFFVAFNILSAFPAERSEYWRQRVSLFESLPVNSTDIIFIGNSITDGGELTELFNDLRVKNRGINSDDIDGVTDRIDCILAGRPAKIFLLIGINDVSHNVSLSSLLSKYETLINIICEQSPESKLYVQSVMPINNDFNRYKNLRGKEDLINSFNSGLQELASQKGIVYIDLWPALAVADSDKLDPRYTNDGLHLTGEGYLAWANHIKPYLFE